MKIADLFAAIGVNIDKRQWNAANKAIDGLSDKFQDAAGRWRASNGRFLTSAERMAAGLKNAGEAGEKALAKLESGMLRVAKYGAVAAGVGFGVLVKKSISLSSTVEDTKLQIAGMLALSKKTDLADQVGNADKLYADLQKRAASLPGTTAEYAQMLGVLTQPLTGAGLGLQDLEDLTVNAVVAAKALGVAWDVGARDIDQAVRGQFHATDQLTGKLLGAMGYVGEKGRKRFNAMTAAQRAAVIKAALTQKQLTQLAEAQGKTFSGRLGQLQDAAEQTLIKIGAKLFEALGPTMDRLSTWIANNQAAIDAFAAKLGDKLVAAFDTMGAALSWIVDNRDTVFEVLEGVALWIGMIGAKAIWARLKGAGPLFKQFLRFEVFIKIFKALEDKIGVVGAAIAAAFAVGGVNQLIGGVETLISKLGLATVAAKELAAAESGGGKAGLGSKLLNAGKRLIPAGAATAGATYAAIAAGGYGTYKLLQYGLDHPIDQTTTHLDDFGKSRTANGIAADPYQKAFEHWVALKRMGVDAPAPHREDFQPTYPTIAGAQTTTKNVTVNITNHVATDDPKGFIDDLNRQAADAAEDHGP